MGAEAAARQRDDLGVMDEAVDDGGRRGGVGAQWYFFNR
jgi:hypothetical protein